MVLFAECPNTTLGFLKKKEGVGKKKITIMKVKLKCNFFFFFLLVGVVPRLRSAVIYRTGSGSHASLGRSRHTRVSKKI